MRMWKVALVLAVLSVVLILTIVANGPSTSGNGVDAARAAGEIDSQPFEQAEIPPLHRYREIDYGWGPVRLTDW